MNPRRLYRSRNDRMIAGVAGGMVVGNWLMDKFSGHHGAAGGFGAPTASQMQRTRAKRTGSAVGLRASGCAAGARRAVVLDRARLGSVASQRKRDGRRGNRSVLVAAVPRGSLLESVRARCRRTGGDAQPGR